MPPPKVYADFQNVDDANRLRLTCAGTLQDLARHEIQLHEGLVLTFYSDDADDQGQPGELRVQGVVHYDTDEQCWVATIDWAALSAMPPRRELQVPSACRSAYTSGRGRSGRGSATAEESG